MTQAQTGRFTRVIGALQIAIIALIVITALIHLQRGVGMSMGGGAPPAGGGAGRPAGPPGGGGFNIMQLMPLPLSTLFLLNGIGYLVLGAALYLPALRRYQPIVRWLLIAFTAVTIIMYFLVVGFRMNPVGLFDKVVELALIALLLVEGRQSMQPTIDAVPARA